MATVALSFEGEESRPAVVLDDVSGFEPSGLETQVKDGVEKIVTAEK